MPILSGDVVLLASAVMADVAEGGGAPTGTVISDAENALFPDISELDRAGGRVNLRKVFLGVRSDDTDVYFGANVVVAQPPTDANTAVTLFARDATFDTRSEAQSRVEAYLNKGPLWPGYLYEGHITGQRVVQLFQRPSEAPPTVGQTLVLVKDEGLSTQVEQYIRAITVSSVTRTFTAGDGSEYQAAIVSVFLSDALRFDCPGSPASETFARLSTAAAVRDTVVADAGTYAGVSPLAESVSMGAMKIKAESIYSQLVPSAQTEAPLSVMPPYAAAGLPIPGAGSVTYTATHAWTPTTKLALPGGCLPGSLSIQVAGVTITDAGGMLRSAGADVGTIDYANGLLTSAAGDYSASKVITYTPAAQVLRVPQSAEIEITAASRSQSYVGVIDPQPQPGTLSASYRAGGRWYVLSDDGTGALKGSDASYGAGTFNPATGGYILTLGVLPDVGSSVILSWGAPTQETRHPTAVTLKATQTIALAPPAGTSVQPGSVTVSWLQAGVSKSATAGADGVLSGHATGTVRVAQGVIEAFAPATLPAVGAQLTIGYVAGPKTSDAFAHPSRQGDGRLAVTASAAITPGSLEVEWNTVTDTAVLGTYTLGQLTEMGVSTWVDPTQYARDDGGGKIMREGVQIGTVTYATGAITWNPDVTIKLPRPKYSAALDDDLYRWRLTYTGLEYVDAPSIYPADESGAVTLRYNSPGSTSTRTETVTFTPKVQLVPGVVAPVVPGTVVLTIPGSQPWGDSGTGVLRENTVASGWLTRGTIDYTTGVIALSSWATGATNALSRVSCVTTLGNALSSEFVFRASSAPLRPGSLSIQWTRTTGGPKSVTAGVDGVISGTGVAGSVDYETGLVRVRFGAMVTAAGNESQPWYSASRVESDGRIWRPDPIVMTTLRYSAVAYSYLPLDASILGMDPVRLPSDGRVPIFRAGGFVVVGAKTAVTATVANGQTVFAGRERLSRLRVVGANGAVISTGYTTDLDAGTATFSDVSAYAQPVRIEGRVEDMAMIRDVQINGEIGLSRPITHDYSAPGSYVSTALVLGDLFARVERVFDQSSWFGAWSDSPEPGSSTLAAYNNADHPILITNRGGITERWIARFTTTTSYELIGEHVGVVAVGNTGQDFEPLGPSGAPYMHIPAAGWGGGGWSVGAILRINTIGAMAPIWVVRTINPGAAYDTPDQFELSLRGDVDA
jgi:hypothetical protein